MQRGRVFLCLVMFFLVFSLSSPCVLGAWADVTVWVDDVMVKYRRDGEDGTSGGSTLTLYAAKNEFEPFQVLVYNDGSSTETINDVIVTQTSGPGTIDDIYIYRMHYINAAIPSRAEYETGFYPDPLVPKVDRYYHETRDGPGGWPTSGIPVDAGKVQGFWVDLGTTANTPAGTYTFEVRVIGQTDKTVTVTLNVWDFEIPSTSSTKSYFGLESSILTIGHGWGYGNRDATTANLEALYVKSMLYHRMAPTTRDSGVWYTDVDANGTVNDWNLWENAYKAALDGDAITSGPYAGARLANIDIELGSTTSSRDANYQTWVNYLQSWWDKFTIEGWDPINKLYCYGWDEPGSTTTYTYRGSDYTGYQITLLKAAGMNAVNTGGAGTWENTFVTSRRTSSLSSPGAGYTSLDTSGIYCPLAGSYTYRPPWQTASQMTARSTYPGYPNWEERDHIAYLACPSHGCGIVGGDYYNNVPDLMIETPPVLTRGIGWIWWHYRAYGFLYYGSVQTYYFDGGDPWYNLNTIFQGNGDGTLFFPGVPNTAGRSAGANTPSIGGTNDIPIESIRLKLFRETFEDREYMEILRNLNGGDPSTVDDEVDSIFTSVVGDPGAYFNIWSDPSYIFNARQNIANQIISAQQGPVCEAEPGHNCYYLSPSGTDCAYPTCGTFENPWATMGYAGLRLQAGDILYVMGGTYSNQQTFLVNHHGTASDPITVKAYPGEHPIFTGSGSIYDHRFQVNGDYWIFDGLEIHNDPVNARIFQLTGDYITIQNCNLRGNIGDTTGMSAAIWGYGSHYNTIINNTLQYAGTRTTDNAGDIVTLLNCDHWLIQDNLIRYGAHSGILLKHDGSNPSEFNKIINNTIDQYDSGIGWGLGIALVSGRFDVEGNCYNLIEGNWIRTGGNAEYKQGIEIMANGNTVRNNIVTSSLKRGIILCSLIYPPMNAGEANRNLIYNNLFYNCGRDGLFIMPMHGLDPDLTIADNLFANNIWLMNAREGADHDIEIEFYHTTKWWNDDWGGNIFKNNIILHDFAGEEIMDITLWTGSRTQYTLSEVQSTWPNAWFDNLEDDPLFTNPVNSDFTFPQTSPCVDAGVAVRDTLGDVGGWGDLTHQGNAPDIGAWESPYSAETGICGDGTCNTGETCSACPDDCIVGDVNGDCDVGLSDLITVAGNFGCSSNCGDSDLDGNDMVNILDLIIVGKNFT